jgi:hypothetical protein
VVAVIALVPERACRYRTFKRNVRHMARERRIIPVGPVRLHGAHDGTCRIERDVRGKSRDQASSLDSHHAREKSRTRDFSFDFA